MFILLIIFLIIAYLMGSLSSAVIVCRLMGLPDPRTEGSKNPGATNVLRIGGTKAAVLVLIGDVLKGFIPVFLASLLGLKFMALGLVALAALIGHIFPVFFEFQGGKGVATALGGILAISFWLGIVAIIVWLLVAYTTRYSSLAALVAAGVATLLSPFFAAVNYFIPILLMTLLLIWRHMDNIQRLRDGTESKIDFSKKMG